MIDGYSDAFLLVLLLEVSRPDSRLPKPLPPLGSLLHPAQLAPSSVIASQPRDFNILALGGYVGPRSTRTRSTIFLPHTRSSVQFGTDPGLYTAVAFAFLHYQPPRP